MSLNKERVINFNVLSSFVLKIIAILTMTVDHIGESLFQLSAVDYDGYVIFKSIGRLAFPLFCFMIVEGVIHTKSFARYCLRMGIIGTSVLIAQIIMDYAMHFPLYQGNIFIDLLLGAIAVKALMDKRWYIKLLSLIPLMIGIGSFFASSYNGTVHWFPYYLRPQYDFLGILLIILFYLCYLIAPRLLSLTGVDPIVYEGTNVERLTLNTLSVAVLIIIYTLYYLLAYYMSNNPLPHFSWYGFVSENNWAMLSGVFILLYSGKRGYNSNWFRYGQYLYYPLHILIIFGICYLIFGG